jgi:DNA-binding NarL/FixJ family response regulator
MMKILIVDDHPLVRSGLREVLRGLDEQACVTEAASAGAALALLDDGASPDLLLLDINLADMSGIEVLKRLHGRHADIPVVVLSGIEDPPLVEQVLALGAAGFIPKAAGAEVIVAALRLVLAGEVYVPSRMPGARPKLGITPRQAEVLQLVLEGLSNKEIGHTLGLAEQTVKAHVTEILRALDVRTRTQAVTAAARYGFRPRVSR